MKNKINKIHQNQLLAIREKQIINRHIKYVNHRLPWNELCKFIEQPKQRKPKTYYNPFSMGGHLSHFHHWENKYYYNRFLNYDFIRTPEHERDFQKLVKKYEASQNIRHKKKGNLPQKNP